MSGWCYVDNISPGRKHPQCLRQTRPLPDVLFQLRTETSSLLAANASVGGSAVPARVGDILTVGGKRVRLTERLFQASFTGNKIGGFCGTSLQSNMGSDVYACKELVAALHRLVARSFDQASNGSLCPSSSFLRGLRIWVTRSSRSHVPSRTMRGKVAHCASGGVLTPSTGIPANFLFTLKRTWDLCLSSGLMLLQFTTTQPSLPLCRC